MFDPVLLKLLILSPCCSNYCYYGALVAQFFFMVEPLLPALFATAGHAFLFFNFAWCLCVPFQMPPRRSVRRKRPSRQAVEAVANSEGPPVRRRRGQIQPSNETPPPPPLNPAFQETVLPVGFLEQVVAVTTEVT